MESKKRFLKAKLPTEPSLMSSISDNPFSTRDETSSGNNLDRNLNSLVEICSERIKKDPKHAKAFYIRASSLMRLGECEKAYSDCNKHLLLEPTSIEGLYLRGMILQRLGKVREAISDFDRVLQIDPAHFNARLARASSFNYVGEFDKAIEDYECGLKEGDIALTNRSAWRKDPMQSPTSNFSIGISGFKLIKPLDTEEDQPQPNFAHKQQKNTQHSAPAKNENPLANIYQTSRPLSGSRLNAKLELSQTNQSVEK
jgi:tetratricopeptide (TPR) repeat protein